MFQNCPANKPTPSHERIQDNTGIKHLPGSIFLTPEYTIESNNYFQTNADGSFRLDTAGNHIATLDQSKWLHNPQTGKLLANVLPDQQF